MTKYHPVDRMTLFHHNQSQLLVIDSLLTGQEIGHEISSGREMLKQLKDQISKLKH